MVIPKNRGGKGLPLPKPANKTSRSKPRRNKSEPAPGQKIDRKTGIAYTPIPKTEMDDEGRPKLQDENFNTMNMAQEAQKYLPHLRVPPDKEEQKRLRAEREAIALKQEREYKEINDEDSE